MKKLVSMLISLLLPFSLVACTGGGSISESAVGSETNSSNSAHEHEYETQTTVAPARGVQGYTVEKCKICGDSKKKYLGAIGVEMPKEARYSFLFVGNSFTFYNGGVWAEFQRIATREGYKRVIVDSIFSGGYFLHAWADPNDEMGAQLEARLSNNKYDFIFIQDESNNPATDPNDFYVAAKKLSKRIGETGARDILFMPWCRKEGNPDLTNLFNMTYEEMSQKIFAATEAAGRKLNIPVSPVGAGFYTMYKEHPEIDLYDADMLHPNPVGTYFAALCHFATVFGVSPIGIDYKPGSITDEQNEILQKAAHDAVYGKSVVKDKYKFEF